MRLNYSLCLIRVICNLHLDLYLYLNSLRLWLYTTERIDHIEFFFLHLKNKNMGGGGGGDGRRKMY